MRNTVYLGFISIILMMTVLSFIWLHQIKKSNTIVVDSLERYNIKIEHAQTMRDATRFRQTNLLAMTVIKDAFELDDEIHTFYEHADPYRKARQALFSMPMNEQEKTYHKHIDKLTRVSQPLSNKIVEMFREGYLNDNLQKQEIVRLINIVRETQAELFKTIDLFVELQKKQGVKALNLSRQQFDTTFIWVSSIGLIALILTIIISRYVANYVLDKNKQLTTANEHMTIAYKQAEEATALKSEFLATMSHEIRTPLTAIIGFAETTLFSEQSKEQRLNSIQTIIRSGKHLLQVVNDILDLSKVEANKLEIEYVETALLDMLTDIEHIARSTAEEKLIGFSINYIYPLPDKISTDQLRVKQILLNLCNNALKFTEVGNVKVNVSYINEESIIFEVVDTGIGISKKQLDVIFQPYRQADSSTTRKFGGTGLGLTLSKLLAERMGGSLSVVSELGKGSQFKLSLPCDLLANTKLLLADKNAVVSEEKKDKKIKKAITLKGHVLLAEDNIDNQDLFSIYLRRIGVDVSIVENGKLAVEAIENSDFDLILMDMRMPVMGGLEAVKLIRQLGFKKTIIAVTANAMQEDKDNCFNAGCDDFLTKPIDSAKLNQALEKYLDTRVTTDIDASPMVSSLLENDPAMINLVRRFVDKYPATLNEIEELVAAESYPELCETLHKLKGTSGNFGFQEISDIAAQMEFQAVNQSQTEMQKLFIKLQQTHQQVLKGLQRFSV